GVARSQQLRGCPSTPGNLPVECGAALSEAQHTKKAAAMAFYVVRNHAGGAYLSLYGAETSVADVREAAIFTQRTTAIRSMRRCWQDICIVERLERLPD